MRLPEHPSTPALPRDPAEGRVGGHKAGPLLSAPSLSVRRTPTSEAGVGRVREPVGAPGRMPVTTHVPGKAVATGSH